MNNPKIYISWGYGYLKVKATLCLDNIEKYISNNITKCVFIRIEEWTEPDI
jgi:hypothetical protein